MMSEVRAYLGRQAAVRRPVAARQSSLAGPSFALLSLLKDALVPLGIYAYFTGFIYIYYFYNRLGISLSAVDVPFYYFFLFSFNVLRAHFFAVMASVLAVIGAFTLAAKWRYGNVSVLVVLVGQLFFLQWLATITVAADVIKLRTRRDEYPRVSFDFKTPAGIQYPTSLLQANADRTLKIVLETKDRYYVLDQPFDESDGMLYEGTVYSVAKADVIVTQIHLRQTKDFK